MKTIRSKRLRTKEAHSYLRDFLKRISRDEKESKYHEVNTKKLKELRRFLKKIQK